jgi:hypothetical protein
MEGLFCCYMPVIVLYMDRDAKASCPCSGHLAAFFFQIHLGLSSRGCTGMVLQ